MKRIAAALIPCFVLALAFAATPTSAAEDKKSDQKSSSAETVVVAPDDKPNRSTANPNDGKDGNPNDGNAGKGDDKKTQP